MIVHYTARQEALTAELKQFCEKRLRSMDKLLQRALEVNLVFSAAKSRRFIEIHIKGKGAGLVVREEGPELIRAVGLAFDTLEKKLKKDQEKFREKKRRSGRDLPPPELPVPAPKAGRRIIPGNEVSVKPLTVEEAALLLDESKRDILVFRKLGSERWAVLYRRKDGQVGLVEPEG